MGQYCFTPVGGILRICYRDKMCHSKVAISEILVLVGQRITD